MRPASARDCNCLARPSRNCSRRNRGTISPWTSTIPTVSTPSEGLCNTMNNSAVSACPERNTGWTKASPTKPPMGSTSSLMIDATSEGLALRAASGGNCSTWLKRSSRKLRSTRSPNLPLRMLIEYLNQPLMRTSSRNNPLSAARYQTRLSAKPGKSSSVAPPRSEGSASLM